MTMPKKMAMTGFTRGGRTAVILLALMMKRPPSGAAAG